MIYFREEGVFFPPVFVVKADFFSGKERIDELDWI